jgi:hypothetical protein
MIRYPSALPESLPPRPLKWLAVVILSFCPLPLVAEDAAESLTLESPDGQLRVTFQLGAGPPLLRVDVP